MASDRSNTQTAARPAIARLSHIAAFGIAVVICAHGDAEAAGVSAVVVKAANGCFSSAVRFTGSVVPRAEAIVNLNIDGYQISEVLAAEGDIVSSGQVLARLTRLSSGAPPGAPGGAAAGQSQAAAAQQPANMNLTAPIGGLVSKSTAKLGTVATPLPLPPPMGPEPLFRIIANNKLEIEGDVPASQLPKLPARAIARVHLENGRDVSSQLRIILPEVDRNTQLGKVRLTLDPDPAIRSGMFARGTIEASHSCGVSIPRAAVQYQTEGTTVQVVRENTVTTRRVRLGLHSDTATEVLEGVKEGELVIANAGGSLHDGDQVTPISADDVGQTGNR